MTKLLAGRPRERGGYSTGTRDIFLLQIVRIGYRAKLDSLPWISKTNSSGKSGRNVNLNTYFPRVSRIRMRGAVRPHPFGLVWRAEGWPYFLLALIVEHTNLPNSVANKACRTNYAKGKGKCKFKILAMWGNRYVVVSIFNLGARCRWVVPFRLLPI